MFCVLATTCKDVRLIVCLLDKGCPSVLKFFGRGWIHRRIQYIFDVFPLCRNAHLRLVHSRASVPCSLPWLLCSAVCRGVSPRFGDVRSDWSIHVSLVLCSLFTLITLAGRFTCHLCSAVFALSQFFTLFTMTGSSTCHLCSTAVSGRKRATVACYTPSLFRGLCLPLLDCGKCQNCWCGPKRLIGPRLVKALRLVWSAVPGVFLCGLGVLGLCVFLGWGWVSLEHAGASLF